MLVLGGCSSVWLERPPVTRKVTGSSPASPAITCPSEALDGKPTDPENIPKTLVSQQKSLILSPSLAHSLFPAKLGS